MTPRWVEDLLNRGSDASNGAAPVRLASVAPGVFFRAHPQDCFKTSLVEHDDKLWLVAPAQRETVRGWKPYTLWRTVDQFGDERIWPVKQSAQNVLQDALPTLEAAVDAWVRSGDHPNEVEIAADPATFGEPQWSGQSFGELIERVFRNRLIDSADHPVARDLRGRRLERITAADLDSGSYHVNFLVKSLIIEGQPHIFAGTKKALKTNGSIDMGLSLATATPFLGSPRFEVPAPKRVVLLSGESGLATIQETARRIAAAKNVKLADIGDRFIVSSRLPRLESVSHLTELEDYCTDNKTDVLIVDPAYLAIGTDGGEASMFKMGSILAGFADVCQSTGVTSVLVHHAKKIRANPASDFYDPPELEDIAYAGFQEFARAWLLIGRRERYEPASGQHKLWLNYGGSVGHGGLCGVDIDEGHYPNRRWDVDVMDSSEVRARQQRQRDRARTRELNERAEQHKRTILDAMRKVGRAETKSHIRDAAGLSGKTFNQPFAELIREGVIVEEEIQKHTWKGSGFRISEVVGQPRTVVGQSDLSDQDK